MDRPAPELRLELATSAIRQAWVLGAGLIALGLLALLTPGAPTLIVVDGWILLTAGAVGGPLLLLRNRRLRRRPVLTIDEVGIHDVRVSQRPVPWSAVKSLGVWQFGHEQYVVLGVDDDVMEMVGARANGGLARRWSRQVGADGLRFMATGLPITFDELVDVIEAHIAHASR